MQMSTTKIVSRFEGKLFVSAAISEYFEDRSIDAKEAREAELEIDYEYSLYDVNDDYMFEPYVEEKYDDFEDDYDPYGYSYDDDFYFSRRDDYYVADNYYTARRDMKTEPEGQSLGGIL